jgi:hypothetical protein
MIKLNVLAMIKLKMADLALRAIAHSPSVDGL